LTGFEIGCSGEAGYAVKKGISRMAKRNKDILHTEEREELRLNKMLSDMGICSRRQADELIASGKVTVDGQLAVTGMKVTRESKIVVAGKEAKQDRSLVLIALNKPRGIVCTTDQREPDNVIDFLHYPKRVFPIGRLDKDSEGLLLLTNDGDIVNKILRAGNHHEKEYIVTVNQPLTSAFLKGMAAGVPILDTVTAPCRITATGKCEFRIVLTQGLNRQIRRMCEYFGYKVLTLKRVRIMNILLGHLKTGDFRNVTDKELAELKRLLEQSRNEVREELFSENGGKQDGKTVKNGVYKKNSRSIGGKNERHNTLSSDRKRSNQRTAETSDRVSERSGKSIRAGRPRAHK